MMVSYSQNFEDVLLFRIFKHLETGFYVDVGAWDHQFHSVTKCFYDRGWRGVNIEPGRKAYRELVKNRLRDINLNCALDITAGTSPFVELEGSGISALFHTPFHDQVAGQFRKSEYSVDVQTLEHIFREYCGDRDVHFLKIDVEGSEAAVIAGSQFQTTRPWIILVEAVEPGSSIPSWYTWEPDLLSKGYDFVWFDGLNRFYVRQENPELKQHFLVPPNVFDEFVLADHSPNLRARMRQRAGQLGRKLLGSRA